MGRTSIEDLVLQGNRSPLQRALNRETAEKANPPLPPDRRSEIVLVDALIAAALEACKEGHTLRGKGNPAFAHLQMLVKTRKELLRGFSPEKKSPSDIVRDVDELLGLTPGKAN